MAKGSPALAMEVVKGLYRQPSSFTDLLPWVEYDPDSGCFLLEDGISVGALFELEAVGTEARTEKFMTELRDAIQTALNDAIPEEETLPGCCRCMYRMNQASSALCKVCVSTLMSACAKLLSRGTSK